MEALAPPSHGSRRPPWQDLPSELLGLVLQRVPSHADRVRLRAVCRPWRAAARLQPALPALLPWLALRDGSFLSLPDGEVHRGGRRGSSNHGCSLMNPLSRVAMAPRCVDLNCLCTRPGVLLDTSNFRKVVVMSDHAVAVRTGPGMHVHSVTVSISRPQTTTVEWKWTPPQDTYTSVLDMAFFRGKLYVLTTKHFNMHPLCLYAMEIVGDNHVSVQCVVTTPKDDDDIWYIGVPYYYLVASGDRLLMVEQKRSGIEVFEAADLSSGRGRWRKVSCSESLPAGGNQYAGAREDCIYFLRELKDHDGRTRGLCSGVYDMRDGTFSPLPFQTVAARAGPFTATWFFPADT
ncbi:hypothetical protein VPH35_042791 [Triticum aestivum]